MMCRMRYTSLLATTLFSVGLAAHCFAGDAVFSSDGNKVYSIGERALASLKILGDDSRAGNIAVSPDEPRVHYVMNGKHCLVTDRNTEELQVRQK